MRVAVVGAGIMGSGIAQVFAQCELIELVWLTDAECSLAEAGKNRICNALQRLVSREKMDQLKAEEILGKIIPCEIEDISDADLVLEAIVEDIEIKKNVLKKIDSIVKDETVLASNTSSLSITEIGSALSHDFIGMHFFNPAPVMKLVEIIAGLNTSEETVDFIYSISQQIGKTPIKVKEAPGFVVNRILVPMINEAIGILAEGTAKPEDIDKAMKLGANHPMGPLELGDLIGLDVVLAIMEVLYKETGDSKYRPAPLLKLMVRAGKLGRKSKEGFYKY